MPEVYNQFITFLNSSGNRTNLQVLCEPGAAGSQPELRRWTATNTVDCDKYAGDLVPLGWEPPLSPWEEN